MRLWLIAVLVLLFIPISHAALVKWDVVVLLNEDRTTDWTVKLSYNETVAKTDYFLLGKITDYEVFADNSPVTCSIKYEVGSSILCKDIRAREIVYKIKTSELANDIQQNFKLFSYKFSITNPTDEFTATIKMPVGSVLADPSLLGSSNPKAFEPESGKEGSDGRRIYVQWTLDKPIIGDTLDTTIVYEQLSEKNEFGLFEFIMAGIVIIILIVLFYVRRRPEQDILPVLTPTERKLVQILLREKKDVDQRDIVKELDLSKTTVSRIISNLVNRGVVEKVSKGRKNIIKLKKNIKRQENDQQKKTG
jgi:uncharacterized membrane protein